MSPGPVNPPRSPGPPGLDTSRRTPPWLALALLAVAFAIVEAAIVTAYRSLLDPQGLRFPLLPLPANLAGLERWREAATLFLLAAAASLASRRAVPATAAFFFLFGVWDLTYYATLRYSLHWPQSWGDWDLLFLLPVPWLGPVYAPMLVACVLVAAGSVVLQHESRRGPFRVQRLHLLAAAAGGTLIVWSFVATPSGRALAAVPARYPYEWLLLGLAVGLTAFVHATWSNRRSRD